MDKPQKKPIRQNQHESNCEWYNKGLEAQKNINKRNELTEDELLFIITPKGLPPLPKHIKLAKKIIERIKSEKNENKTS